MSDLDFLRQYYHNKSGPIQPSKDTTDTSNQTIVDKILELGDDPNFAVEPEDKYKTPKELNQIQKLRKDGFDNERIFEAMEAQKEEQKKPVSTKPDLGVIGTFKKSFKRSRKVADFDVAFHDTFYNVPGSGNFEDLKKAYEQYETMAQNDPIEADNFLEYVARASGQLAGSMSKGLEAGIPSAAAGMTGAAIVGNLSPLALVPEEVATVPISGATGFAVGSTYYFARQGAGNMLKNMLSRDVDPVTASLLASTGGLFYGLVEQAQIGKIIPKSLQKKANDVIAKSTSDLVGRWAKQYGKDWATQIAEEELQLGIEFLTTEVGAVLEGVPTRTWQSMVDEAWETAKQTAAGLLPIQGGRMAVDVTAEYGPSTAQSVVNGIMATNEDMNPGEDEVDAEVQQRDAITIETTAKEINDDEANPLKIEYNADDNGDRVFSESRIRELGYDPESNGFSEVESKDGERQFAVTARGTNDIQGNISLTSRADRSTLLEEAVEARLKQLRNSKNAEEKALADKIEIWARSVRKLASEIGYNLRFTEEGDGNLELFSDAILYTIGGFKTISKEFQDAIYIPEDISSEFIEKMGQMSDGTLVFDKMRGPTEGIEVNQEFATAVDEDIFLYGEDYLEQFQNPPPTKKNPKAPKSYQLLDRLDDDPNFQNWHNTRNKELQPSIDTPEFRNWFKESKITRDDDTSAPLRMFHGTTRNFQTFDIAETFHESDFGSGFYFSSNINDVNRSYATEGSPDLLIKSKKSAQDLFGDKYGRSARQDQVYDKFIMDEFMENKGNVMPVYLSIQNPFVLGSKDGDMTPDTYLEYEYELDEETGEVIDETGPVVDMIDAVPDIFADLNYRYDEDSVREIQQLIFNSAVDMSLTGSEFMKIMKDSDIVADIENEDGKLMGNEFIRRVIEAAGFDGIVLNNANDRYSGMFSPIMGPAMHVVAFEPNQIKSQFNRGTFDPRNNDITFQLESSVVEKAVGLYPDVVGDKERANRVSKAKKRAKGVGQQTNKRVEIKLKNGGVMILGRNKTPEDWIRQVESTLNDEEVMKAAVWYEEAYPSFVEEFGEKDAVNYMVAWLLGNVQASPLQALSNTFLAGEQLKAALPSFKTPGTESVATNIKSALKGKRVVEGAGAKLYDFLDSALGKSTRTVMMDDPFGLAPVAIDRHTFRDAGYIDGKLMNILKRLAVNKNDLKGLVIDQEGAGPSETQYEYASRYMNELTDKLNEMGYLGGNLKPHQVQAIGWTAIARMSETSDGQSIPDAMELVKPQISFKLDMDKNSPLYRQYGDAFERLRPRQKESLNKKILNGPIKKLAKEMGLKVIKTDGRNIKVRGSSQAVKGLMHSIGLLTQKENVAFTRPNANSNKLGIRITHPKLNTQANKDAVISILMEELPKKFMPSIYFDDGALMIPTSVMQRELNDYSTQLNTAMKRVMKEVGLELNLEGIGINHERTNNNWKKDSAGQRYRNKLSESFGPDIQKRLDNHYGPQVEQQIREALEKKAKQDQLTYQLGPNPNLAAQIKSATKNAPLELSDESISGVVRRKIIDALTPIITWQEDIESQFLENNKVTEERDVVLAAELAVGRMPERISDFNDIAINGHKQNSFVNRLIKNVGISIDDFSRYLHAQHAAERNAYIAGLPKSKYKDGGSGMSNSEAKRIKAELNKKYGLKNLRAYTKEFRQIFIEPELKVRLDAGLLSQKDYDSLKDGVFKNYVPLFREMDDSDNLVNSSGYIGMDKGKGFNIFGGREYARAKGSKKPVKNIIVSAAERMHNAIIRAEKNEVNKKVLALVQAYPSDAFEVKGISHKPVYNDNGEIEYMTPLSAKDSEGNKVDQDNVLNVKVDGKTKRIIFKGPKGTRIAKALRGIGVSKAVPILNNFNTYLRYVNTIWNVEFIFSNFVRDIQTAGINISAEQGGEIRSQALSPTNLKNSWKAVYDIVQNDEVDSEWGDLYNRMRLAGGKTGFFDIQSIEQKLDGLEKSLNKVGQDKKTIKDAGKNILGFVESLNEATESSVRLTLFKAMIDAGYSDAKAASAAKNVTINFNRKGEWGPLINSLWLFANAGLQGSYRIMTVVGKSKKAQQAVATLVAMGFMESFVNHMADDDEEYDKLGNFVKDNYFVARYGEGDKYLKFRLPYGFNVFKVVGNITGDFAWAAHSGQPIDKSDQLFRLLTAINASFNPLGDSPIEQMITPTIVKPFIQLGSNKNFYGGPIYPQVYQEAPADVQLAWENTPAAYKESAEFWYALTGNKFIYDEDGEIVGAEHGPLDGFGDVSPETLEYFTEYLSGGLGKSVARLISAPIDLYKGNLKPDEIPLIRNFFGEFRKNSELGYMYNMFKNSKRKNYTEAEVNKLVRYAESYLDKNPQLTQEQEDAINNRVDRFLRNQDEYEK
jgi:hypothetical protein